MPYFDYQLNCYHKMLGFNYQLGYYRRNNFGQPCVWYARPLDDDSIIVFHGIVGKTITSEIIHINRKPTDEIKSRVNAKRKTGYKLLSELKDNVSLPVEGELLSYLDTYLPQYRTTADGTLLPMLAKVYDNTNNKLFNKVPSWYGQWKINGLRCFISAEVNHNDFFKPIALKFQSREGTYWNSLVHLEDYLLSVLDKQLLNKMVEEHYILDGELYIPNHSVNEINHFVKDAKCAENKLIQYWCYDIAIDDFSQADRLNYIQNAQSKYVKMFGSKDEHFNNTERLVILPVYTITNDANATLNRNEFIDLGFEGLIMRNPIAEYQYGKRQLGTMVKYKRSTDGKFTILDIYPEGIKRKNIPLFLLKNDINDATFEVHIGGSQDYQSTFLNEDKKRATIGKQMYVEYGERSGVNQVPFHVKDTFLL